MKIAMVSLVLGSWVVVACSGSDPAVDLDLADGGSSAPGAGDVVLPPDVPPITGGCDKSQLPSQDECVLHESVGVFVSKSGSDTNDGTKLRPYATLTKAMTTAKASGRRIYACAETYSEATLELLEGVAVFGNLTCAGGTWAVGTQHAVLAALASPAARATDLVAETRIEGLDLVAPTASTPGASSIGLVAVRAAGLHFVQARIAAGDGADGTDGAAGIQLAQDAAFDGGVESPQVACEGNTTILCSTAAASKPHGGVGVCIGAPGFVTGPGAAAGGSCYNKRDGNGTYQEQTKPPGSLAVRPWCPFPTGAASTAGTARSGGYYDTRTTPAYWTPEPGFPGAAGAAGTPGELAAALGTVTSDGYVPANGSAGTNGSAGQGGGGGAGDRAGAPLVSSYAVGPSGSGGGAGGCPGLAGTAGTGGGASIAVLATGSALRLDATVLTAGRGGQGGKGTLGSAPTPGGVAHAAAYWPGGDGGAGGEAGWSGHGGSGPSFGIAWTGIQPVVAADSTVVAGAPREGRAGEGALPGAPAGIAEMLHAF